MTQVELVDPGDVDLDWMAERLRASDREEAEALTGRDAATALRRSVAAARESIVACIAGAPVAIYGVGWRGGFLGEGARPWMVATDALGCYGITFVRASRVIVADWRSRFGVLENWVDDRHKASKKWLAGLGFTLHEPEPFGALRLPFRRFSMGD